MKNKSLYKTILGAALFIFALCGFSACKKSEPGLSQGSGSPLELPWLPPLFYDARFIFALILGVAVMVLTVIMAVRIIHEKRADKRAERAVAQKKWKAFEDKEEEKTK